MSQSVPSASEPPRKKGMGCLGWGLVVLLVLIVVGLATPGHGIQERAQMLAAANNARQIIMALKAYAEEHGGRYPDAELAGARTSNEVLRELIRLELLEDERVFTAPVSPSLHMADNDIGEKPDFIVALEPGENHWCLVKGLTDKSEGNRALIFENPAHDYAWPPVWNADVARQPQWGRSWTKGRIVIGRNDGSVEPENLVGTEGLRVPLPDESGEKLFPPGGSFLPVARDPRQ